MNKYNHLDEMKENYIDNSEGGRLAKRFLNDNGNKCLTANSFRAFFEEYEEAKKKKEGGAKFSERVFSYWTMKNLTKNGSYPEVTVQCGRKIKLHDDKNDEVYVTKKFDFFFKSKKKKKCLLSLSATSITSKKICTSSFY